MHPVACGMRTLSRALRGLVSIARQTNDRMGNPCRQGGAPVQATREVVDRKADLGDVRVQITDNDDGSYLLHWAHTPPSLALTLPSLALTPFRSSLAGTCCTGTRW